MDEATFAPKGEVPLPRTAPNPSYPLQLSQDKKRFLSYSANLEDIEVVDIASRKVVQTVRLSEGRVITVTGRRAQDLANAVFPGLGVGLTALVALGGLAFNVGNVAGAGLGLNV